MRWLWHKQIWVQIGGMVIVLHNNTALGFGLLALRECDICYYVKFFVLLRKNQGKECIIEIYKGTWMEYRKMEGF